MKTKLAACGFLMILCVGAMAATTRYVVPPGSGNTPTSPYTSWATAATNLHAVMAVTVGGDTVLLTNGVYMLTNQIIIATNITIRSDNNGVIDRAGTIVNGGYPNNSNRCFTLSFSNAVVEGLTITNGYVVGSGGGVYITAGTLRNCLVTGNTVTNGSGGGVYAAGATSLITNCDVIANLVLNGSGQTVGGGGVKLTAAASLRNSRIMYNNSPIYWSAGGGVHCDGASWVVNCSVISNKVGTDYNTSSSSTSCTGWPFAGSGYAYGGGGVWAAGANAVTLRNCLIIGNGRGAACTAAGVGSHGGGATIENCTIVANFGDGIGAGSASTYNVTNTISFYNTGEAMRPSSSAAGVNPLITVNCCMTSTNYVTGGSGNIIGTPAFMQRANGDYRLAPWSRGVDAGLTLSWMSTATDLADNPRISANSLPDMGAYETTFNSLPATYYVAHNGQTPVSPYTNGWAAAASNITDVLNVMSDGGTVLVTNGVYTLTNHITVGYMTLRSYNNNGVDRGTIINGNYPNTTNRCLTLNHADAVVDGFTITNGFVNGTNGGGVLMTAGTLRNCLVTGNTVTNSTGGGGGVYATGSGSVVTNCDVIANTALCTPLSSGGGGVMLQSGAQVWNSRIMYNQSPLLSSGGGGIQSSGGSVFNSSIISNTALAGYGSGGVWVYGAGTMLRNCLIMGNGKGGQCNAAGVGSHGGSAVIESCTIVTNFGDGIGANNPSTYNVTNTISFYNTGEAMRPSSQAVASNIPLITVNCCMTSTNYVTGGSSNIITTPLFVNRAGGNYRLLPGSPGVDAGVTQAWMSVATDLDGQPRISVNGLVDMGAYETSLVVSTFANVYVAKNGQTPAWPYTNWVTAATNIPDALSVLAEGGTVLVSNGVYTLTAPIVVGNFNVRSFNNNGVDRGTVINGNYPNTTNRCFTLNHVNALVEGFTITNGCAPSNDCFGGGVYMTNGILRNCLVTGNLATNNPLAGGSEGGGVYATGNSVITNCDITANSIWYTGSGGGVYLVSPAQLWNSRILFNGTPTTNSSIFGSMGGGVYITGANALICNSVISSNTLPPLANPTSGGGVYMNFGGTLRNCLVAGNSAFSGAGVAVVNTPVSDVENCTIAGNFAGYHGGFATPSSVTLQVRLKNVICYYNQPDNLYFSNITNALFTNCCVSTAYSLLGSGNMASSPAFMNRTSGDYRLWPWSPGVDAGLVLSWMSAATDLAGQPRINNLPDMGAYETTLGVAPNLYVAQNGQTPVSPYTNWMGASSNIQDAVNMAFDGATVLVSNGVYTLTDQLTVGDFTVRSYNNNGVDRGTIINGNYPNTTNRCFTLNHVNAVVEGFTITNGCAPSNDCFGGGVYMTNGILRNCLVTGNRATNNPVSGGSRGGGVYAVGSSLITNCDITANTIGNAGFGGGVYLTTPAQFWNSRILHNGTATTNDLSGGSLGGGAYIYGTGALICNSIIASNAISPKANSVNGGGVYMNDGGTLRNCLITGNSAFAGAGVAVLGNPTISDVESCTIAGNFAGFHGGLATPSAAIVQVRVKNVICYSNQPDNLYFSNITNALFTNCCTVSSYTLFGSGNITNNPLFVDPAGPNYRLTRLSPCVDTGVKQGWMTDMVDLDGKPRIWQNNDKVDMGAYELDYVLWGSVFTIR
ncbi:MAG: choice-of-anchor Q domain-containing protein [bacterium]